MPLRDDVVQGVRVGTILLAVLLVADAAYRMMREYAGAVESAPAPVAAPARARSAVRPAAPAGRASVPPPPPASSTVKTARRNAARQAAIPSAPPIPPEVSAEETAAAPSPKTEPVAAANQEKQALTQTDDTPEPVAPADNGALEPESRPKRFLRAVGRFLHVAGRKEPPQQSIR